MKKGCLSSLTNIHIFICYFILVLMFTTFLVLDLDMKIKTKTKKETEDSVFFSFLTH